MNIYTMAVIQNIMALCCILAAAYIIALGRDGWGWLIFAGVCFITTVESKK